MKITILLVALTLLPQIAFCDQKDEQYARDMIQILDDFKNFDDIYEDETGGGIINRLTDLSSKIRKESKSEVIC